MGLELHTILYFSVWPNSLGFLSDFYNPLQSLIKVEIKFVKTLFSKCTESQVI